MKELFDFVLAIYPGYLVYWYLDSQYRMWNSGLIINQWSKPIVFWFFENRIKKKEYEWSLTLKRIHEEQDKIGEGERDIAYGYKIGEGEIFYGFKLGE